MYCDFTTSRLKMVVQEVWIIVKYFVKNWPAWDTETCRCTERMFHSSWRLSESLYIFNERAVRKAHFYTCLMANKWKRRRIRLQVILNCAEFSMFSMYVCWFFWTNKKCDTQYLVYNRSRETRFVWEHRSFLSDVSAVDAVLRLRKVQRGFWKVAREVFRRCDANGVGYTREWYCIVWFEIVVANS